MAGTLFNTALDYLTNDNLFMAENILKKIVSEDPNDHKSYYLLGWVNEKLGRKEISREYYISSSLLQNDFFDIDEKIEGGQFYLENKNFELFDILNWMIKQQNYNGIKGVIAKANLNISNSLINEQITVKKAKQHLYNKTIKDLIKPYSHPLIMLIFDIGMNLNLWGFMHPWNFPVAFSFLKQISSAIINTEKFINSLNNKEKYNFIELEIIKKLKCKNSIPTLIKMLSLKTKNLDNVIHSLGLLDAHEAIFPLLHHLKKCRYEDVYPTVLALTRIGDNSILPVIKKYIKKYIDSDLSSLLYVCLCRLEMGKEKLLHLSKCADVFIREEAVNQIADFKDVEAIKVLLNALFDEAKISDFYPVRAVAYEKLEEMGLPFLRKFNKNLGNIDFFKDFEKVFFEDKPKILWLKEVIKSLN